MECATCNEKLVLANKEKQRILNEMRIKGLIQTYNNKFF